MERVTGRGRRLEAADGPQDGQERGMVPASTGRGWTVIRVWVGGEEENSEREVS